MDVRRQILHNNGNIHQKGTQKKNNCYAIATTYHITNVFQIDMTLDV